MATEDKYPDHERDDIDGSVELQDDLTELSSIIGRKWHLVILHELFIEEALGFSALKDEIDGISSKVLAENLEDLEEHGLVTRTIVSERPLRVEYELTDQGESFTPILEVGLDNRV